MNEWKFEMVSYLYYFGACCWLYQVQIFTLVIGKQARLESQCLTVYEINGVSLFCSRTGSRVWFDIVICTCLHLPHTDTRMSKQNKTHAESPQVQTWIFHEIRSWLSRGRNIPIRGIIPHTHKWNLSTGIRRNAEGGRDIYLRPRTDGTFTTF